LKNWIVNIKSLDRVTQLIIVLSVLFIPTAIVPNFMLNVWALPADYTQFIFKPWTLITYSFIHENFLHLFSNVLVLYFIGNIFLDFFSEKKFWIYYIMGSIAGGLFYLIYEGFNPNSNHSVLLGASAAITALMLGITSKIPHYGLNFRFIGRIELWILSSIWILLSIIGIGGFQAGAAVAHLGGGLVGYLLTLLWELDVKVHKPKTKFKTIYRNPNKPDVKMSVANKRLNNKQVDNILDKISKSGYDSLTKEEREFLFNQKNNGNSK